MIFQNVDETSLSSVLSALNALKGMPTHGAMKPVHIGVLSNFTINGIFPFLEYHCAKHDLAPQIHQGRYDAVTQELLDPQSEIFKARLDLLFVALHLDQFLPDYERTSWDVDQQWDRLFSIFELAKEKLSCPVLVNTFMPPKHSGIGTDKDSDVADRIHDLNGKIRKYVHANAGRFFYVDWNQLVMKLGHDNTFDHRYWYMSKAPFKSGFLSLYAKEASQVLKAKSGKIKKCLILDCDNTLWGGVIGEDGIENIKLDSHEYPGNVFHEFHKQILQLHEKGVLLALCSKNNEADVIEVLESHSHCLLKPQHFVARQINWENKAENIVKLSKQLNLGLDSFVFVDDSSFECELVRERLPDVTVLDVPQKIYELPSLLHKNGIFFSGPSTTDDKKRTEQYQVETKRKEFSQQFGNIDEYLKSLEIVALMSRMSEADVPRVAQLTQKTNQFNLTTKRYSVPEIQAMLSSSKHHVFVMRTRDKFGDMGLTNVFIGEQTTPNELTIDTYLMSCRVFERNLEYAFFSECIKALLQGQKFAKLRGSYVRTKKNEIASRFYEKIGFSKSKDSNDEQSEFVVSLSDYQPQTFSYIKLEWEKK